MKVDELLVNVLLGVSGSVNVLSQRHNSTLTPGDPFPFYGNKAEKGLKKKATFSFCLRTILNQT